MYYNTAKNMSTSQKQEQGNTSQAAQPQQYQPGQYHQKQYPRKQYYGKKGYRGGYGQRYDNYQGDKKHARIVVKRETYHKLVQYVLKYYGTLKGMSNITSELLDKAIDMDIADKEKRKNYAQEMHLHSET
jgi:hypothetical protein